MSEKVKAKDIIISIVVIVAFAVGLVLVLNIYAASAESAVLAVPEKGAMSVI